MPPSHQRRRRPSSAGTADFQVASSNSTLNAFIGGKQPAWMSSGTAVKPTPRPNPPRQSTHLPPQQTSASLLPSPAPSDEPSPAMSNPHDSPHTPAVPLPDHPTRPLRQLAPHVREGLPVTDARFIHEPSDPPQVATSEVNNGYILVEDTQAPISGSQAQPRPASGLVHPHQAMSAPAVTQAHAVLAPHAQPQQGMGVPVGESQASSGQDHPSKRRRLGSTRSISWVSFRPNIDQYIQSTGGEQRLTNDVEKARFSILKEACLQEDTFYLALHQCFALWSLNRDTAYRLLACPPSVIDSAFEIIGSVLKKNSAIGFPHVVFFSKFPGIIDVLVQSFEGYAATLFTVTQFLIKLSDTWASLVNVSFNRQFPYLVDELIGLLHYGHLGNEIEQAFKGDQKSHTNERGEFVPVAPILSPQDLEVRNSRLVQYYRQVVKAGQAMNQSRYFVPPTASRPSQQAAAPAQAGGGQISPQLPSDGQWTQVGRGPMDQNLHRAPRQASTSQVPVTNFMQQPPQIAMSQASTQSPSMAQGVFMPPLQGVVHAVPNSMVLPSSFAPPPPLTTSNPYPQMMSPQTLQHFNPHVQNLQQPSQNQQQSHHMQQMQQMYQNLQFQQLQGNSQVVQTSLLQGPQVQSPLSSVIVVTPPGLQGTFSPSPLFPSSERQGQPQPSPQQPAQNNMSSTSFLPSHGYQISRSDFAYDPNDKKSVIMSLHQADVRSPKRVKDVGEEDEERYYQQVASFALAPTPLTPESYIQEFKISISQEQYDLLCKDEKPTGSLLPVSRYSNGSLRYRLRCCKRPSSVQSVVDSDWVTLDGSWPPNIFMTLNGAPLSIRRLAHNGKDLPVELTAQLRPGENTVKVVVAQPRPVRSSRYFIAVEILETLRHSEVLDRVWKHGLLDPAETLGKIRSRLYGTSNGDGIAVTVNRLSVDLADPFSATIFKIPARGETCTHMECFDLETWLTTRPSKSTIKCPHRITCSCPATMEPSNPDKWRCPICFKDARPASLRIDQFFLEVRAQLEQEGKLRAKSMLVDGDGSWEAVIDDADDDDEGSDGDEGIISARSKRKNDAAPASTSVDPRVEVIDLVDDD